MQQFDPTAPAWRAIFPARLTAVVQDETTGENLYSWIEQIQDVDGTYTDAEPARRGDAETDPRQNPARELNNASVTIPADEADQPIVWMRVRGVRGTGDVVYEFSSGLAAGGDTVVMVKVLSGPDATTGRYTGKVATWSMTDGTFATGAWVETGDSVIVVPSSRATGTATTGAGRLEIGSAYLCRYLGMMTTGSGTFASYQAQTSGIFIERAGSGTTTALNCQRLTLNATGLSYSPISYSATTPGQVDLVFNAASRGSGGYITHESETAYQYLSGYKGVEALIVNNPSSTTGKGAIYFSGDGDIVSTLSPFVAQNASFDSVQAEWSITHYPYPTGTPIPLAPLVSLISPLITAMHNQYTGTRFIGYAYFGTYYAGMMYTVAGGWRFRIPDGSGTPQDGVPGTVTINYQKPGGGGTGTLTFTGGILTSYT